MADPFSTSNGLVKNYRQFLESSGRVDRRSDLELTVELGQLLKSKGTFDAQAEAHPDFREQYLAATQATDRSMAGEVAAGVRRGARGLAGTAMGAAALGLDLVGADDTAKDLALKAREVASGGDDNAPTVERMDDVRNVEGGLRYAAGKVGEAAPSLAEALITATIGAAAGSGSAPGPGTAAGAVAGFVGKRAVKQMINRGIAKRILGEEVAEEALEAALKAGADKALQNAFVSESRTIAARMGGAAASALNSLALNSGGIYNETGDAALSLTAGAIAAAPDTILPSYIVGRFFRGAASPADVAKAGGFVRRLATEAVKVTPIEASTEAFQELVGIAAEKFHKGEPASLDAKDIERLKEAAVGGAAGGFVAAPIAAAPAPASAPVPTAAIEARRRAASGLPATPAAPAQAAPITRGERLRSAMTLTPELQDARITALGQLSSRTAEEEQELEVLRALQSQRPATVARTPAASSSAPAVEVKTPAAPVVAPPTAAGAAPTPLVATPIPPPAPSAAAPHPPAPTPIQLSDRIRTAGAKLGSVVSRVPSLATAEVRSQLEAIAAASAVTADDVTKLEASVALLEAQAVTESAKIAASRADKKQELASKREAAANARLEKQVATAAARADKLARKLQPEAASVPAPTPPSTPAPAETPAVDTLRQDLDAALNPPPAPATPLQSKVVDLADFREAVASLPADKLKEINFEALLKLDGAQNDDGNRAKTRIALVLRAPDGSILLKGVTNYSKAEGLRRIGTKDAGAAQGVAVQAMGSLKGKDKGTKIIEHGGKQQVLLNDLVRDGYVPLMRLNFDGDPAAISQRFESLEKFELALGATEKVAAATTVSETQGRSTLTTRLFNQGDGAMAAAEAVASEEPRTQTQSLVDALTEALSESPLGESLRKRVEKHGTAEAALASLPKMGREQVDSLLKEAGASPADLIALLGGGAPAASATPATKRAAPSAAPATPLAQDFALPNVDRVTTKFFERLHSLVAKAGSFDVSRFTAANVDAAQKLFEQTQLGSWDELKAKIEGAYSATKTPAEFAAALKGRRNREDAAPSAVKAPRQFAALVERLRSQGFDVELIQRELGEGQHAFTTGGAIGIIMDDVANANLTNVVGVIHEVGHLEVDRVSPEHRAALSRAVDRTIAEVRDGRLIKAAKNANANWEEKLVESLAIKLTEEGVGESSPSIAAAVWRAIKDLYLRVGASMLRALGVDAQHDRLVAAWFENNMRRRLGGDYDYRFIDLFRPFIEKPTERVSRHTIIDGQDVPDLVDPLSGALRRAEVLPDTAAAAEWNLNRHRLTREEGYYKGKKFSEILASVRPEPAPGPINPSISLGDGVRTLFEVMKNVAIVKAADGRTIDLRTGDSETARLLFGTTNVSENQRIQARAVHLLTHGNERTRARPEKLAGINLLVTTLEKADLVLENPSQDSRTPDQKSYVYVKLYQTPERTEPTWHFVRTDHAGRLISQHTAGPLGGYFTPAVESGVVKAATGEKSGSSSVRAPRHQNKSEAPSEGTPAGLGQVDTLASLVGLVNPTGWSKEKLSATVLKGVVDGAIAEEEAGPLLRWIEVATPEQRQEIWKKGGGGLLREDALGAALDMDYTEAMARVQASAWGELMPTITRLKAEVASSATEAQFWKIFGRGSMPGEIIAAIETRVPGASNATIGGDRMTDAMNQRARYQAFRLANAMATLNRRRAAGDEERLARHTENIAERAKLLNKIDREYRDAEAMNAVFNDGLRDLIKELAVDLDRGPDTAFAAGKLAGAIREIERLTPEEAIPEMYQSAFKQLLDADGTSVFDQLSAIARLNLPLSRMTSAEVVAAIKENAAADNRLASLIEKRPLMAALATLASNSARQMDLLQLRTLKDSALFLSIKAELDEIRTASEERLDEIAKGIAATQESKSLRDRLRGEYVKARREFNASQRAIQKAQELKLQRTRFADALAEKAVELSREVGAFSFWEATDGATYRAMQRADDGSWTAFSRTLRMTGDELAEQHERVAHDLAFNRLWLEAHREQAGSRLFEEVRRQTEQLSKLDFAKNYEASHRFWMDRFLQPLGQKFASTGEIAGAKIKQMLNAWQTVMFVHSDEVDAASRRWNKALQEASTAAGYSNPKRFFDEVVSDVIYHVESEPGRDEVGAMREARRAAMRRIPESFEVSDAFGDKLAKLLHAHRNVSELMLNIAEKNGVYVADPRLRDPLTGKGNLQRHAIKYGWLTSTRRLRGEIVRTLVNDMQAAGWSEGMFDEVPDAGPAELVARYFTPGVIENFVEPFVMKPGKEVFFGANDADGRPTPVSQVDAQLAWQSAGGDLLKFIEAMFDRTNESNTRAALPAYQAAILKRFGELYTMESKLAAKASQAKSAFDPFGAKQHRVMDGRVNDLIPPEHFAYDMFSPIDARRALTEVAFHAAFGRDGNGLDATLADLKDGLLAAADRYRSIPDGTRKEKAAYAAVQGWDFKKLERAARDATDIGSWEKKLVAHFTGKEAVVGDARALLELMQLNMSLVLNQPKSGLWNLLSLVEYPLVYRGLGRTAVRASLSAAKTFAQDTAGSLLQAFGLNFQRTADYAREIAEVVERRKTERLPIGTLLSDIGPDGRFAAGGTGNRVTQVSRGIQTAMRKGVGAGGFNALWAPFNFISTKADTAIATANVQAFEMVVKRAIEFFEATPSAFDNPAFRLNAEQLRMTGGGWFSDEGAFNYFRERAGDYGLGSIEQIARDAMARRNRNESLLTRDQALGVSMMALNEISLQASVNNRPVELIDNPILRFGGLMMGWPIAKVNQIHDAMKTPDGRLSMASALRTLGVMAAWSLPMGLAYSLLMDEYDEKILSKKSNIRDIDPVSIIPLAGPVIAAASDHRNFLGMLERLARAGTYGLAGDAINSFANMVDPATGQRDFDLNSRVLAFSQFANLRDSIRNLLHQDFEVTYQSITRPLLNTMGGGGVLQATQIVNSALGLTNAEAAVTNRINVQNWLRAAGREVGLEMRMGGGRSSPTPLSVWLQQMQTAALTNDRLGFAEAYRSAVEVARRQGEPDPEKTVLEGFKSRNPLSSVFRTKPTETQFVQLLAVMDDGGQRAVREALTLFDSYTEVIEPSAIVQKIRSQQKAEARVAQPLTIEQLRRRASSAAMGYN